MNDMEMNKEPLVYAQVYVCYSINSVSVNVTASMSISSMSMSMSMSVDDF